MTVRVRSLPPRIRQSLTNSCWAAVLESWSTIDSLIPSRQEQALIARFGEGPTGGITPAIKIPLIARYLQVQWGGFRGNELYDYLFQHLQTSHVFLAYREGQFSHSVLVYKFDGRGVNFMDPRTSSYRTQPFTWFGARAPLVLMRR